MALSQLGGEGDGEKVGDVGAGQVVDVVVFRDHEGVPQGACPVDRAVDLQDDRPLVEGEIPVLVGPLDDADVAPR